jgi:dTMP kinase
MPTEFAIKLMEERKNKITGENTKDIHERDEEYLKKSYENALDISKKMGWLEIKCIKDKELKSIAEIAKEILEEVNKV